MSRIRLERCDATGRKMVTPGVHSLLRRGRAAPRVSVQLFIVVACLVRVLLSNAQDVGCGSRPITKWGVSFQTTGTTTAAKGEFPWQVSLRQRTADRMSTNHYCGGVLVNDHWVLTTSHCLQDEKRRRLSDFQVYVRAGEYDQDEYEGTEIQVRVTHVYVYRQYTHLQQDVALLRLEKKLHLNPFVQPICVPVTQMKLNLKMNCTISGWGNNVTEGKTHYILKKFRVSLRPLRDCQYVYPAVFNTSVQYWHLCAGRPEGNTGVAFAESGGPLQCELEDGRWYVIGLASFGSGCYEKNYPDVYTRVPQFVDWILASIFMHPTAPLRRRKPARMNKIRLKRCRQTGCKAVTSGVQHVLRRRWAVPRVSVQLFIVVACLVQVLLSEAQDMGCGNSPASKDGVSFKIIGGVTAIKGEFPWQMSIRQRKPDGSGTKHFCGGALLNDRWVLTAAHCIQDQKGRRLVASQLFVRAGEHNEHVHEGTEIQVRVTHVYVHPQYTHLHRDVALLRLAKRLRMSRYVQPVCLPDSQMKLHVKMNCTISGWGNTATHGTTSYILNKLRVPLRPLQDCERVYSTVFNTPIHQWHLCGGRPEGNTGVCFGDSGGPYQCELENGRWYVMGLASFGSGCAKNNYPDVYTRVPYFVDWILSTIRNHRSAPRRRSGGIRDTLRTIFQPIHIIPFPHFPIPFDPTPGSLLFITSPAKRK